MTFKPQYFSEGSHAHIVVAGFSKCIYSRFVVLLKVSDVDRERYRHALDTSVRKYLTENKYLPVVLANKQPPFSSVRELDSGLVTAGK